MNENFQKLLEGSVLTEEVKSALTEAWEAKIVEAREEINAELREEYANRYEHDKATIVEATEKMVRDALKEELEELFLDKKAIKEQRLKVSESAKAFIPMVAKFLKEQMAKEISEFRTERKTMVEGLGKVQQFVSAQLKEELTEFNIDRTALIKERVEFEKTKKAKLAEAKKQFIEAAAKSSERVIRESLSAELSQLKDDIAESKKSMFGKKLYEAFATEFMSNHFNEQAQVKKLNKVLESAKKQASKLEAVVRKQEQEIKESRKEVNKQKELRERADVLNSLLAPLDKDNRKAMQRLLESTPTNKLNESFKKYLGVILKGDSVKGPSKVLTEGKTAYDGNRVTKTEDEVSADIVQLKALSGLK